MLPVMKLPEVLGHGSDQGIITPGAKVTISPGRGPGHISPLFLGKK